MSTPDPTAVPAIDPFAESMAEAAQTSAAAFRLMMAISDAVRRAAQKMRTGAEEELAEGEEELAPDWAADALRPLLDGGVLSDLMAGEDWPRLAGQMAGLQRAGVDLTTSLPQLGQMAKTVHQAVEANQARISAAGSARCADLLKTTMPEGLVRDAILASPAWPDMVAKMALLDRRGVDVAGFLTAAHGRGVGVDRAVATLLAQQAAAAPVAPAAGPAAAAGVPAARTAPAPAAPGPAPAQVKAALMDNGDWEQGAPGDLASRMAGATVRALTTPPGVPVPDGPRVSAARCRSTTTPTGAAPGQQAPSEAAVPAHRQQAAASARGRLRPRAVSDRSDPRVPYEGEALVQKVMARRRRRVGCSALAGVVLGVTGWWADWAGYGTAGTVLEVSAGVAVLAGAWRTGGRHLSWAEPPPGDGALPPDPDPDPER
ncbi:hypothetical protein AB0M92_23885 [Streptomyces sp. NPDC051582]|uniref:hypothetical protein n=1 Tax=Streptomyces sp. NPDC051582 TaxID=3155167 RepID=UPI0034322AAA